MGHLAAVAAAAACTFTWHGVPSPALWGAELHSVAASSADDAWAVGGPAPRGRWAGPVVEHWNGNSWLRVRAPAGKVSLQAVTAVAHDDVWAVGGDVLAHWDGSRWRRVSVPWLDGLAAVSATAHGDVWAVGKNVVAHWDGVRWQPRLRVAGVADVAALAADDVWAVAADGHRFVELHWDGSRWSRYAEPVAGDNLRAVAVSAAAPGDVWAVGDVDFDGPTWPNAVVFHWSGGAWRRVPTSPRIFVFVNDLIVAGPDLPLLTGFGANGDAYGGGALEQLTGTHWQETGTHQLVLTGFADDHAGGLWGVGLAGSYVNPLGFPTVYRPLVERARCP